GPFHDIVDVGPIADLLARPPYFKWILPDECASNHGDDCVIFFSARPIDGEVTARRSAKPAALSILLQCEFTHQLRPTIHVVSVVWRAREILGQIELLLRVFLKINSIDTSRGSKYHLFNICFYRLMKQLAIENQVHGAFDVMKINVASAAMNRRKMK